MLEFLWPAVARHGSPLRPQSNLVLSQAHPYGSGIGPAPVAAAGDGKLKRKRAESGGSELIQAASQRASDNAANAAAWPQNKSLTPATVSHASSWLGRSKNSLLQLRTSFPLRSEEGATSVAPLTAQHTPTTSASSSARDLDHSPAAKRQRIQGEMQPEIPKYTFPITSKTPLSDAMLRQTIESQFSLEILLKHRELRLIDQEIAKCQVSLEQLRRCRAIPFPTETQTLQEAGAFLAGENAVQTSLAPLAAPWGVTDGPYSRHYQQWLLPDPVFDEYLAEEVAAASHATSSRLPDRSTRGTRDNKSTPYLQPRPHRSSSIVRPNAAPYSFAEAKEEKGPMVAKRASDGHMVKLVCIDCQRSNFNSVQGFINHCRIAHARQFVSHDAAIEASGQEVDGEAEIGATTEAHPTPGTANTGLVHPMIKGANPIVQEASEQDGKSTAGKAKAKSSRKGSQSSTASTPRRAKRLDVAVDGKAAKAPYLSALYARDGDNANIHDLIEDAKIKVDLPEDEEDGSEEEEEAASDQDSARPVAISEAIAVGSAQSKFRPTSGRSMPGKVQTAQADSEYTTPSNLSPNSTDAHPAPSLVSDDGDNENTHSESDTYDHSDVAEHDRHYMPRINHDGIDMNGDGYHDAAHHPPMTKMAQPALSSDHKVSPASVVGGRRRRSHATPASANAKTGSSSSSSSSSTSPHGARRPHSSSLRSHGHDAERHVSFTTTTTPTRRVRKPSIRAAEAAAH